MLYAEETLHGSTENVYIDLHSIPNHIPNGQRLLEQLKKLFAEARSAKEPSYGFRFGDFGYIFQAKQFFDSLGHDECEKPILFDLSKIDELKAKIFKSRAGIPVAVELVQEVQAVVELLGLATTNTLKKVYSAEHLFNSFLDVRASVPGDLVLNKGRDVNMNLPLFTPTLLFSTHCVYTKAGFSAANAKFRQHPLAKLACMLNQLFAITVVPDLNMMAQLLALALDLKVDEVNKMKKRQMRCILAGSLDTALRHVVFAQQFRFLKFEKADGL